LSSPVMLELALAADVEVLARHIAGEAADPSLLDLARRIAEAQIDLRRVRSHRLRFIATECVKPLVRSQTPIRAQIKIAKALLKAGLHGPMADDPR
jgi:hypothetical protein